ncbi:fimbria/pilus periplasmic chaperone [Providencia sp. Je.9.19]|uniref:fimbria/pilus periplasmic chaperone n=1 Tax=Providencia sp. Je.9.19 TaxID=3142844 RepID=UPI003DA889F7
MTQLYYLFPYIGRLYQSILIFIICLGFSIVSFPVEAGGVALGATRVIYPLDSKQTSLALTNSDEKNRFLIQSWIENDKNEKTTDLIITPPLFVSNANSENTLRIIRNEGNLPKDRESLYWLNTKAIPSVDRNDIKDKNVLQIAILSRIKIFIRPANLPTSSGDAAGTLSFSRKGKDLIINNPSPYYVTLINLKLGTQPLNNIMVAPMSKTPITTTSMNSNSVSYQTIDDYGGSSPISSMNIN